MIVQLLPFVSQYLGRGSVGTTPGNTGQCVGLIETWVARHQLPAIPGNAVDLLIGGVKVAYRVVMNNPTNAPLPGDIVCWNGSWGNGYGHCAIALAANANRLVVFEQNDPEDSPCLVATHGYGGVEGWLQSVMGW